MRPSQANALWNAALVASLCCTLLITVWWLRSYVRYDALIRQRNGGTYIRVLSSRGSIRLQLAQQCPLDSDSWHWHVSGTSGAPWAISFMQIHGPDGNVWTLELIDETGRLAPKGRAVFFGGPATWLMDLGVPYWTFELASLVIPVLFYGRRWRKRRESRRIGFDVVSSPSSCEV